jgi:hypothetical protein
MSEDAHPCDIAEGIEAPASVDHSDDRLLARIRARQVGGMDMRLAARILDQGLRLAQALFIEIYEEHFAASLGDCQRSSATKTAG